MNVSGNKMLNAALLCMLSSIPSMAQKISFQDTSAFIRGLVSKMTLEEKAGQMTQLTVEMISERTAADSTKLTEPHRIDPVRLKRAVSDAKVGSILNMGGHTYTVKYWNEIQAAIRSEASKTRLKIPVLYGIDAIHGANYTVGATLYPQPINLAASFDATTTRKMAIQIAKEVKECGIPWDFSPVLDVGRDPRWPRFWETFGEDVLVVSEMGKATVEGYLEGGMQPCLKHYMGYSQPFSGKDRTPAMIPERQLREIFLPPFAEAIRSGAMTVMVNSAEINGIPVHADRHILTEILKEELNFQGFAVSDWDDIQYLYTRHKIASSYKDAVRIAVNAGIDMAMVPMDYHITKYLIELVNEGAIPQSRIDDAVSRILRVKIRAGLFGSLVPDDLSASSNSSSKAPVPPYNKQEHTNTSYRLAVKGLVLLKNENQVLPLKEGKIIVAGPTANSLNALNGGWTHTWQGRDETWNTKGKQTLAEALKSSPKITVQENGDVVVLCVGEQPYTEKEGDIEDLQLPADQRALIRKYKNENKKVVLVYIGGRPRTVADEADLCDAILWAGLPGDEGGRAIAAVLTGEENPSGRLPFTWPRHPSSHTTYDHKASEEVASGPGVSEFKPLFHFGDGLSYTSYEYSSLSTDKTRYAPGETIRLSVKVKNTGSRNGENVVLVYASDLVASITPPVKRLRAFSREPFNAGEERTLHFSIPVSKLSFIGREDKPVLEPGEFRISVGSMEKIITVGE